MVNHEMALVFWISVLVTTSLALVPGRFQDKCDQFSKDIQLCHCETIGDWYLQYTYAGVGDGKNEDVCFQMIPITQVERDIMRNTYGGFMSEPRWERVVLKLARNCSRPNVTAFFEQIGDDGSFISTALMEGLPQKNVRMKIVNDHLMMVDCTHFVTLVFGKRQLKEGETLDPDVKLVADSLYQTNRKPNW